MSKAYEDYEDYEWWDDALHAKDNPVQRPPIHEGHPHVGFFAFRTKRDDGSYNPYWAAAIWRDGNDLACICHFPEGQKWRDPYKMWTWVAGNPVSYDDYQHFVENGGWPSAEPTEADMKIEAESFEEISSAIAEYQSRVKSYIERNAGTMDRQTGETAADMLATTRELWSAAEKLRKTEKAPVDAKAREIQATYSQVLEQMVTSGANLKEFLNPYCREYGTLGKASVHLVKVHRAKIEDYQQTLQHFSKNTKVMELIQKLADEKAKDQKDIPGCKLFYDTRVQ